MATIHTPATRQFAIERDMIETTRSGLFGGERDVMRQFTPGPWRYLIDDVEVSRDEYIAAGGENAHVRP
jgi:hypothetical protein